MILILGYCQFVNSTPNELNEYTDYVPKYRGQNKSFILAKIEYTPAKMILHFRYVAGREEEAIGFSGESTTGAWRLFTSSRSGSELTRYASLKNITINGEVKAEVIEGGDEPQFFAKQGEIVSGEAHFSKLPSNVRSINFSASDLAVCHDILIKDDGSPMLGTAKQMEGSLDRFYNMMSNFGVDVIRENTVAAATNTKKTDNMGLVANKPSPKPTKTVLEKAAEPVNYVPKELTSANDLGCDTRVILKNVYFNDNSAKYAGRVEAMATIKIIVEYMNYYHESNIILHGHTDVYGSNIKNLELSEKRVLTVRNTLVTQGIDGDRIIILHHGDKQPLKGYEEGGRKNRRVEAEISCGKK